MFDCCIRDDAKDDPRLEPVQLIKDPKELEMMKLAPRLRGRRILTAGAIRLLSAVWLIAQGENYVIQCRQDLPEEAFLGPEHAAELFGKRYGVVVVSYGWLSKKHPDPTGFHIRVLQKYLKKQTTFLSGLKDCGVFWDFASIPQDRSGGPEKTEQERRVLRRALSAINSVYADSNTLVVQLTRMPEELRLADGEEGNLTPYEHRGWCFFEATVSALLKQANMLLDLGLSTEALEAEDSFWVEVRDALTAERQPLLTPEDMEAELKKRVFTDDSDAELVTKMYKDFFAEVALGAEALHLGNCSASGRGWGDAEVQQFARALPALTACKLLNLRGHGALGESGLAHLRAPLLELPALRTLWLPTHLERTAEGRALQEEWLTAGKKMWTGTEGLLWFANDAQHPSSPSSA